MRINFQELKQPYFIAEVGINHNGDMQIAKKLIDATFACSWDCVKFQKRDPDVCVPEDQKSVKRMTPWGEMTYLEYRYRLEFGKKEYDFIDNYCQQKPLAWTASVWDLNSLDFIKNYDVPFLKVPSAKLTDLGLLIASAKTGLPVILSTGMSTVKEVDTAVETIRKHSGDLVLLHTNSSYPAKVEECNLKCIKTLRDRYKCPVGYSGHEQGLEPTVMAAILGACVIERHITIDHELWGTDQAASVAPMGMDMLYKRVKDVGKSLGDGDKRVFDSELSVRKKLRGY